MSERVVIATKAAHVEADMRDYGLDGYVVESDGAFYIPVVMADKRGRGDCGRWLDHLPHSQTFKFPSVISPVLDGMLRRRGFTVEREWAPEFGESVLVHVRRPAGQS